MVLTSVDICNIALSQLGGKYAITSLDDDTVGARLCKANYAALRDAMLEELDWSFAKVQRDLSPSPEASLVNGHSRFALHPSTLRVIEVYADGVKSLDWQLEQRHIVTRAANVVTVGLETTEDVAQFSQAFSQALAARLAAELCLPMTNSVEKASYMWKVANSKLNIARTNDGLQGSAITYPAGRVIKARR